MDIRTKLVFALVTVSLGSMFVFGLFTYDKVRDLLEDLAVRQLESVAEIKKEDLGRVIEAWRDRVQLVTSRTQLKLALQEFRQSGNPEARTRIVETLNDALVEVQALRGISVYGPDGSSVASSGLDPGSGQKMEPSIFWLAESPVVYENVSLDPQGELMVTFVAPIRLHSELIGAAKVVLGAGELIEITDDYTGLGQTGETLMARKTPDGGALILNPLRYDAEATLRRVIDAGRTDDPAIRAVFGKEDVFSERARDYRGEEVWASTRYLDEFRWGIVVKIDRAEELRPIFELRDTMVRLAVSLSAFAIVAGTALGFAFARPIRELAEVVHRIRQGELDLRAKPGTEDEIGQLADTFNRMAEDLIEKNRELEQQVREQGEAAPRGSPSARSAS